MGEAIDWEKINKNLPYAKTKTGLVRRRGLWRAIDVNDNGFLSLAEVTRSVSVRTDHSQRPCQ